MIIGISAAVILLVAVVALFAYRSLMGREPPHVAVVQGSEQWVGAHLTVSGDALPQPYTAVVERTDRYTVPFFLPPGQYTLVVRRDGSEVHRETFQLQETRTLEIPLPSIAAHKPSSP